MTHYDDPEKLALGRDLADAQDRIHFQKVVVGAARLAVLETTGQEQIDAADDELVAALEIEKIVLAGLRVQRNQARNHLGMNSLGQIFNKPPGTPPPAPRRRWGLSARWHKH